MYHTQLTVQYKSTTVSCKLQSTMPAKLTADCIHKSAWHYYRFTRQSTSSYEILWNPPYTNIEAYCRQYIRTPLVNDKQPHKQLLDPISSHFAVSDNNLQDCVIWYVLIRKSIFLSNHYWQSVAWPIRLVTFYGDIFNNHNQFWGKIRCWLSLSPAASSVSNG